MDKVIASLPKLFAMKILIDESFVTEDLTVKKAGGAFLKSRNTVMGLRRRQVRLNLENIRPAQTFSCHTVRFL